VGHCPPPAVCWLLKRGGTGSRERGCGWGQEGRQSMGFLVFGRGSAGGLKAGDGRARGRHSSRQEKVHIQSRREGFYLVF
jgi:hypothetical protein